MTNRPPPSLAKWPFIAVDLIVIAIFAWIIRYGLRLPPHSTGDYIALIVTMAAWMISAWFCLLPWLKEYESESKQAELDALSSAIEQIQKLEDIAAQVKTATGSWQSAQDAAARVNATAREIEERIKADSKDFMEFAERINNDEKQHLRLEVEKLRRAEGEWLQVAARMLDHTFAITSAALRSGQPNLANQMTNFQSACREAARRVGLVPFHPTAGEPFDERSQQLEDPNFKPEEGSVVTDVLATGYTFQGQLLRKALVRVAKPDAPSEPAAPRAESLATETQPTMETQPTESIEPEPPSQHEQSSADDETKASAVVTGQIEEQANPAPTEDISVVAEPEELEAERNEPTQSETSAGVEDFVVDTYRPSESIHETQAAVEQASNQESVPAEVTPAEPQNAHEHAQVAEVALPETTPESVPEDKPRRRQRKPDPQTSLPF